MLAGEARAEALQRKLDRYTLLAPIEAGGMAEVYVARLEADAGFHKLVAVKRVLPHLAGDAEFIAMFQREARIASRIAHSNVCQVFDFCKTAQSHLLVMEYLEGATIKDVLGKLGALERGLEPRWVAGLIGQAADGLHAAHELCDEAGAAAGVVHRDVSPSNLFVTVGGLVKVLDFGIAKSMSAASQTKVGIRKGKAAYMSPEQAIGTPLDRRSDVFALGTVAWELLMGRRLFLRDSDYESLRAVTREPIPRLAEHAPHLPAAVAEAVDRALERNREHRHPSARAFQEALTTAVAPIGGAVSTRELATFIETEFAEQLADRREVVAEACRALSSRATESNVTEVITLERQPGAARRRASEPSDRALALLPPVDDFAAIETLPATPSAVAAAPIELTTGALVALVEPTAEIRAPLAASPAERPRTDPAIPLEPPAPSAGPADHRRPLALAALAVAAVAGLALFVIPPPSPASGPLPLADLAPSRTATATAARSPAPAAPTAALATEPTVEPLPSPTTAPTAARRAARRPDRRGTAPAAAADAPAGFLTVVSTRAARLYLDGDALDDAPVIERAVPAGRYRLTAVAADGARDTRSVRVRAGETEKVRITWDAR